MCLRHPSGREWMHEERQTLNVWFCSISSHLVCRQTCSKMPRTRWRGEVISKTHKIARHHTFWLTPSVVGLIVHYLQWGLMTSCVGYMEAWWAFLDNERFWSQRGALCVRVDVNVNSLSCGLMNTEYWPNLSAFVIWSNVSHFVLLCVCFFVTCPCSLITVVCLFV